MFCINFALILKIISNMAQSEASITIRVDSTLKKNFDDLCEEFGLSITSAINIFMRAVVREKKIPFEIRKYPEPWIQNPYMENLRAMQDRSTKLGLNNMSLEDINAEIEAYRRGE